MPATSTLEQTSRLSRGKRPRAKLPSRTKSPGDVASSSESRVWQESQIPGLNETPEGRENPPDVGEALPRGVLEPASDARDDDEEIAFVRRSNRERRPPTRSTESSSFGRRRRASHRDSRFVLHILSGTSSSRN